MDGGRDGDAWRWWVWAGGTGGGLIIHNLTGGRGPDAPPLCSPPQHAAWLQLGGRAPKLFGQLRLSNSHVILGEQETAAAGV